MEQAKLQVELVGDVITACLLGECTADMLRECQLQVLALAKNVPRIKVLYNALEMRAPNIDLVVMQQVSISVIEAPPISGVMPPL